MASDERLNRILELMIGSGRVEVAQLSSLLGVSQVTVRKDLDKLESRGLITRAHGFATVASLDDMSGRLAHHYDVKNRIANSAAQLVADGEVVMIESGSACAMLAHRLATAKHGVTIVTNSAFIAYYVRKAPNTKVVLLGGNYQSDSQALVGPLTRAAAANFHVGKMFMGTDGFSPISGFTCKDDMRAEAARDMAANADEVIILTESSKFRTRGVVPLLPLKAVSAVYTDDDIPAEAAQLLREQGIKLETVPAH